MKNLFLVLNLVLVFLTGCVSLNSISITPVPKDRSHSLNHEVSKFVFMGFNFDNYFVNDMVNELALQCPQGKVEGILTKSEQITYFPGFANTYRISSQGYCVK